MQLNVPINEHLKKLLVELSEKEGILIKRIIEDALITYLTENYRNNLAKKLDKRSQLEQEQDNDTPQYHC